MEIANIYPIANQKLYKNESFVMVLAHLIEQYEASSFNPNSYVIMDNGLYEKAQVSTDIRKCIELADNCQLKVNEIIIPDVVNDPEATIELFKKNLPYIEANNNRYAFMFVAQAKTIEELNYMIMFINQFKHLNLTVGISKLSPIDRGCAEAVNVYKKCCFPIHFLGLKESFSELKHLKHLIRSCDSSQLAFIVKNKAYKAKGFDIIEYTRKGKDIDLAVDNCDQQLLQGLKTQLIFAKDIYGLL